MPPLTPPVWLVAVRTAPPARQKGSLASLPCMAAKPNPAPKAIPFTAGMAKRCWEKIPSTLHPKSGAPCPAGIPSTAQRTQPPTESPWLRAARMRVRACSGVGSDMPPMLETRAVTVTPRSRRASLATAPAKTRGAVSRPEKCPPPR